MNACILIKAVPLKTDEILEAVKRIKEVKRAYVAYGRYDLVAFIEVQDYSQIRTVTGGINSLEGVRSTETLIEA